VREGERLAASVALLVLAMTRSSVEVACFVIVVSVAVLRWHHRSLSSIGAWLAAPVPFLGASTLAGWWGIARVHDVPVASVWQSGAGEQLFAQALRAEACTAAVGIGVLSVSLPVAAAAARRVGMPPFAIEVLVLALRGVQLVGHTLRARVQTAPLRYSTRSTATRLRTGGWLAATLAAVTHHRVRRLDAMMDLRGAPDWVALASLTQPARPAVIAAVIVTVALAGRVS